MYSGQRYWCPFFTFILSVKIARASQKEVAPCCQLTQLSHDHSSIRLNVKLSAKLLSIAQNYIISLESWSCNVGNCEHAFTSSPYLSALTAQKPQHSTDISSAREKWCIFDPAIRGAGSCTFYLSVIARNHPGLKLSLRPSLESGVGQCGRGENVSFTSLALEHLCRCKRVAVSKLTHVYFS